VTLPQTSVQPPGQTQPPATAFSLELASGVIFDVIELRRLPDQGAMQLKFAVTNKSGEKTSLMAHSLSDYTHLKSIEIIDPVSRKVYQIGWADRCLCSTFESDDAGTVRDGRRREFWAWYALPPPASQRMTIHVAGQPPLTNVPLQ